MSKYTREYLQSELIAKNITLVSKVSNLKDKHDLSCNLCSHQWAASLSNYIHHDTSCPKCSHAKRAASRISSLSVVEARLTKIPITLVSTYTKIHDHHDVKCDVCSTVWSATLTNIFNKKGCKVCHIKSRLGSRLKTEEVNKRLEYLEARNIKLESEVRRMKDPHNFSCLLPHCLFKWTTSLDEVYRQTGCPKCSPTFADEESINKKIEALNLRSIKSISPYIGCNKPHKFECLVIGCNHTWTTSFSSVYHGKGCPKCSGYFIDEDTIQQRINNLNIRGVKLLSSYKGNAKPHEFECLLPNCQYQWVSVWNNVFNKKTGCPRCAGKDLTDEEKAVSKYRNNIRKRISTLFKTGSINISVHKDGVFMSEVLEYCKTEFSKSPTKPDDNQKWHLDHIIPIKKFDHTNMEHIKLCWDARNLQWLPAKVNISKSAKLMPQYFTDWHYNVLDKLGLSV